MPNTLTQTREPKKLEVCKVGADPNLERGLLHGRMNKAVVQIYRMEQCQRPVLCWEAGAVKESLSTYRKLTIIDLDGSILGRAVGARWFNYVAVFPKEDISQCTGTGQLATLVSTNGAAKVMAKSRKEGVKEVSGGCFGLGEETPYIAGGLVDNTCSPRSKSLSLNIE
jgi:hypothetical protein